MRVSLSVYGHVWSCYCDGQPLMYFDLNVPISLSSGTQSNKGKGKQSILFNPAQLAAIEARIDLLVHCPSLSTHHTQ